MKFAVIHTGGKQYKVAEGDVLKVEKISDTLKVGDKVVWDDERESPIMIIVRLALSYVYFEDGTMTRETNLLRVSEEVHGE